MDGVKVQNLDKYDVQSPLFNMTFPQDNIFGASAGPTQAVSDGYWVFLKPLPPSKHEIHFSGLQNALTIASANPFGTEVSYHLMSKRSVFP